MNFFDSILEVFGLDGVKDECLFKSVMIGDKAVYLENVCGIAHYTQKEIMVNLKKGGIIVRGEGLEVKKYCAGDLAICGKIKGIEKI